MIELHFICRRPKREGWVKDGEVFRSRAWIIADDVANKAIGGRIYLHGGQKEVSWHGGRVTGWRVDVLEPNKKEFIYVADGDTRVSCTDGWGVEKAIIERS